MTVLNVNVKNTDAMLDGYDIRKINAKFPKMPRQAFNKLKNRYASLSDSSFVGIYENGIGCLIDPEWNALINDNDKVVMEEFWEKIIRVVNEGRHEQLIPNLPAIDMTDQIEDISSDSGKINIKGNGNIVNSGNAKNSHNKDNSDNTLNE